MSNEKNIKPISIFLQLLLLFAILITVSYFFPKDGIKVGEINLEFTSINEIFGIDEEEIIIDETKLPIITDSITKNKIVYVDTAAIRRKKDSIDFINKNFQYSDKGKASLYKFFKYLDNSNKQQVRIIHFGDSQIEGDRMSGVIRNELQKKFGGYGPGLFPVKPIANSLAVNLKISDNWERTIGFRKKDTTLSNKFGVLLSYSNYNEPAEIKVNDSISTDYKASIQIRKHNNSYRRTRNFDEMRVFYNLEEGQHELHVISEAKSKALDTAVVSLHKTNTMGTATIPISKKSNVINIYFKGESNPDILGISLESKKGVILDNVALRGSSGTIFRRNDKVVLKEMFKHLNPKLIILQFGGNVIPYLSTEKRVTSYVNGLRRQINFIKKLNPNAAIVFIGPGDMSTKKKTKYVTYPIIPQLIDSMREMTIKNGCIYWDMYQVMGGKNSMAEWVNSKPEKANKDHIHFTPTGAKWVSQQFVKSLLYSYDQYKLENASIVSNNKVEKKDIKS